MTMKKLEKLACNFFRNGILIISNYAKEKGEPRVRLLVSFIISWITGKKLIDLKENLEKIITPQTVNRTVD